MSKRFTEQRLYNIALFYLSKYEASSKQVSDMLRRRLKKAEMRGDEIPPEVSDWVASVIEKLQSQKFLSDQRFMENKIYRMTSAGKSNRQIALKMKMAGIDDDLVDSQLENTASDDLARAIQYVTRKKIGFMRPEHERVEHYQKDLARLARQGFSLDTAKRALMGEEE